MMSFFRSFFVFSFPHTPGVSMSRMKMNSCCDPFPSLAARQYISDPLLMINMQTRVTRAPVPLPPLIASPLFACFLRSARIVAIKRIYILASGFHSNILIGCIMNVYTWELDFVWLCSIMYGDIRLVLLVESMYHSLKAYNMQTQRKEDSVCNYFLIFNMSRL